MRLIRLFVMLTLVVMQLGRGTAADAPPRGALDTEALALIQKSVAVGWTAEQVAFLAGKPELVQKFSGDIEVWRYRAGEELLLVGFLSGKVVDVVRRKISDSVQKDTVHQAIERVQAEPFRERLTWQQIYPAPGYLLTVKIGAHRDQVFRALAEIGVPEESVTCKKDASDPSINFCTVDTDSIAWKAVAPIEPFTFSGFVVGFQDDRFRTAVQLMAFSTPEDCLGVQTRVRSALATAFGKPAKQLAWWRRKVSSMLIPMASIAESVSWESGPIIASVSRGSIGSGADEKAAVLVAIGEKDP